MEPPKNVARFEQLMYLSLAVGIFVAALRWNESVQQALPLGGSTFVLAVLGGTLVIFVLLIWLVARRRKNWARWLMLVLFILGLPPYVSTLGKMMRLNPASGVLNLTQVIVQVVAFALKSQ